MESSTDFPENEDEILMSKANIRGDLAELLDALQRSVVFNFWLISTQN